MLCIQKSFMWRWRIGSTASCTGDAQLYIFELSDQTWLTFGTSRHLEVRISFSVWGHRSGVLPVSRAECFKAVESNRLPPVPVVLFVCMWEMFLYILETVFDVRLIYEEEYIGTTKQKKHFAYSFNAVIQIPVALVMRLHWTSRVWPVTLCCRNLQSH